MPALRRLGLLRCLCQRRVHLGSKAHRGKTLRGVRGAGRGSGAGQGGGAQAQEESQQRSNLAAPKFSWPWRWSQWDLPVQKANGLLCFSTRNLRTLLPPFSVFLYPCTACVFWCWLVFCVYFVSVGRPGEPRFVARMSDGRLHGFLPRPSVRPSGAMGGPVPSPT